MFYFLSSLALSARSHILRPKIENAQESIYVPKSAEPNGVSCTSLSVCPNYRNHVCDGVLDLTGIASKYASLGATVEGIQSANPGINFNILNKGLVIKIPIQTPTIIDENLYMFDKEFTQNFITVNGSEILCYCYVNSDTRSNHKLCQSRAESAQRMGHINKYGHVTNRNSATYMFYVDYQDSCTFSSYNYELRKYKINGEDFYGVYNKRTGDLYDPGKTVIPSGASYSVETCLTDDSW